MRNMMNFLFVCTISITWLSASANISNGKFIEVFESLTCGCCDKWVDYMKTKGYELKVHKSADFYKVKEKYEIKDAYQSCHTGVINGFVLEGHIPVSVVEWLLANKPKNAIGVAAPGMPQGSPGMEQGTYDEYPVILLLKNGEYELLGTYKGDKLIKAGKIKH